MTEPAKGFLGGNLGLILLIVGIGAYIVIAGKTGSCTACSAITGIVGLGPDNNSTTALEGAEISGWSLVSLEGKPINSADLKGKVVILDFWATWCPPCRKEIPGFIELQEQYGPEGLVIIGVALDDDGPSVVNAFAEKIGINYTLAMGNQAVLRAAGGVEALPTTLIINREGKVVDKHIGYAPKSIFEKTVKSLL